MVAEDSTETGGVGEGYETNVGIRVSDPSPETQTPTLPTSVALGRLGDFLSYGSLLQKRRLIASPSQGLFQGNGVLGA